MFYDQFIDGVVQKHTLEIFSSLSQITPAPPFRINFTVSVTGKSWSKQKTCPCGRSGPLPPSIEAQDPVIVRFLPTRPWSDDLSILQFGRIWNPSSLTCQYIIDPVVGKKRGLK